MNTLQSVILTLPEYQFWYEAIRNDDFEIIEKELDNKDENLIEKLLNGTFQFKADHERDNSVDETRTISNVWHLVVTLCSQKTIGLFLSKGVHAKVQDGNKCNFVHNMVWTATMQPHTEDLLMESYKYIMGNLDAEEKLKVLTAEDKGGMRPLELAIDNATTGLFQAIIETKDVYVTQEASKGVCTKQRVDVSEYEMFSKDVQHRAAKSPLSLFLCMDVRCIQNKHTEELLNKDYFKQWLSAKTKINLPLLWSWYFLKLLQVSLFILFDLTLIMHENDLSDNPEQSCEPLPNNTSCMQRFYRYFHSACSLWLAYFCMAFLLCIVFLGKVYEIGMTYAFMTKYKHLSQRSYYKQDVLAHGYIYLVFEQFTDFGLMLNVILRFLRQEYGLYVPIGVDNLTYYSFFFGFMWSVLYIVQLVPHIGVVALVLKLMLRDTIIFFIFLLLMGVPYSQLFPRIVNYKVPLEDCDNNWDGVLSSIYSSFLLLFNVVKFDAVADDGGKRAERTFLCILHIAFAMHLCVMMLNFLIALLSNSLATVLKDKQVIMTAQKLCVILNAEFTLLTFTPSIARLYYRWIVPKCFKVENERVYLSRVIMSNEK